MANGRNPGRGSKRGIDTGRDVGPFVALPWAVTDSAAYKDLSPLGKAMVVEVARQYHRHDNGRMLLSRAYLATRGWLSADAIQKAKTELLAAGLIFQTVMGHRPNKASWYAVTWRSLDKITGYDAGIEQAFERGAYRKAQPREKRPPPAAPESAKRKKNAALIPVPGTATSAIVPVPGTVTLSPVPVPGAIRPTFAPLSVPVPGNPLDVAICGGVVGGGVDLEVRFNGVEGKRRAAAIVGQP